MLRELTEAEKAADRCPTGYDWKYHESDCHCPMILPTGKTCADCVHYAHCLSIGYTDPDAPTCDFIPNRFREAASMLSASELAPWTENVRIALMRRAHEDEILRQRAIDRELERQQEAALTEELPL